MDIDLLAVRCVARVLNHTPRLESFIFNPLNGQQPVDIDRVWQAGHGVLGEIRVRVPEGGRARFGERDVGGQADTDGFDGLVRHSHRGRGGRR